MENKDEKNFIEDVATSARLGNKESLHELITFADNGNAEALYELVDIYLKGLRRFTRKALASLLPIDKKSLSTTKRTNVPCLEVSL